MTNIVIIVQARMGSTRFPGKMQAELCGHPLMEWVLRRCQASKLATGTVLATTDLAEDDLLCTIAEPLGVPVFRGSSADVLDRYVQAASLHDADVVVRICGDRPLVAPEVIDQAIDFFRSEQPDLAFNHVARDGLHWPRGFGAEILSNDLLQWLGTHTTEQPHREHVTLYAWDHANDYRIVSTPCPKDIDPGYAGVALDVDYPAHLDKLREICEGCEVSVSAAEVMQRWRRSRFAGQVDVA